MAIKANELRRGMAVNYKDGIWVCTENTKVAKGKGQSYQSISLKNVQTGQCLSERFRTTADFDQALVDRRRLPYSYSTQTDHVLMDPETYDEILLPLELIGDQAVYLIGEIILDVSFVDGKPLTAELPNTVELTITDTSPQVKGATATNQLKDAECEGGAKIRVPPFVENGTVVKVDTRTGEYLGRA